MNSTFLDTLNITVPACVIDLARVRRNIERMADKARRNGVLFRPHFKTHQSAAIGEIFRELGCQAITASSLEMARYFRAHGWRDITVAVPFNVREMDTANALAADTNLGLLFDSLEAFSLAAGRLEHAVDCWIKIDVGYGRSGIPSSDSGRIDELARSIARCPHARLAGLLTHSGHTYKAAFREQVAAIFRDGVDQLDRVRSRLHGQGFAGLKISVGDTPGCSIAEDFAPADEVRPGNFVFHDLVQRRLGVCTDDDIACVTACPVLGVYPDRIVVYGGAVHLSKDSLPTPDGPCFGYLVWPEAAGWGAVDTACPVVSLTQEVAVIRMPPDRLDRVRVGGVVLIVPPHSCLSADLHSRYYTTDGRILDRFVFSPPL